MMEKVNQFAFDQYSLNKYARPCLAASMTRVELRQGQSCVGRRAVNNMYALQTTRAKLTGSELLHRRVYKV